MDINKSLEEYRADFPALKRIRNGKPPVYLDNACTTLVPQQVIDAINEYYTAISGLQRRQKPSLVRGRSQQPHRGEC